MSGPQVAIADGFTQLVAHALAHVKLDRAGNLYDSRYVAWAREHVGGSETLEHDAMLIGEHWRRDRRLDVLHRVSELHGELDEFRRTAARPLAELGPHEVRSPGLLAALRDEAVAPMAELLHTTLALIVDDFAAALGRLGPRLAHDCARLPGRLQRLAAAIPGLEHARIEVVWALGMHGRAFPDRILVGAPTDWCGCSPERQAVLAAHEWCVRASEADDYLGSEWDALTTLARRMQQVRGLGLVEAHRRWLAELNLDALLRGVVAQGWISHDEARALMDEPSSRADRLALNANGWR
jgi:hypothetical protein